MKQCFYTIADDQNAQYVTLLRNSLQKFHPDIEFRVFGEKELAECGVPKPRIFYMGAPFFGKKLMDEGYERVYKIDADSIVTGSLTHIIEDTSFDVATVLNINRVDPPIYGFVSVWDITPQVYFNNGFVAVASKEFMDHWFMVCNRPNLATYKMGEQDLLNILCYYGNYKVKCLDHSNAYHGLISKGEWPRCEMRGDDVILPKGPDNYPAEDKFIKIIHWAGGANGVKMNYKSFFQEDVIKRLDYLTHE